MKATEALREAAAKMEERAKEYDKPEGERSIPRVIAAFNALTGRDLTNSEGWLIMGLLKKVRMMTAPYFHEDSAKDDVAYTALYAEELSNEKGPAPK